MTLHPFKPTYYRNIIVIVLTVTLLILTLPLVSLLSLSGITALGSPTITFYDNSNPTKNTYDFGYCTFWAAKRREDINKPIPNSWGNANTWSARAKLSGNLVDHTPILYAIMQTNAGELGHVAFVEQVDEKGGWTVSEMNAPYWDVVSSRSFASFEAQNYNFIH